MSNYIGYTGKAIIKEEFREDFLNLYNRKYSKMKTEIMRKYVRAYGYRMLNIKNWNNHFYNDEWDELLPTSYDEETGSFSYGVTFNSHNNGVFECIDMFIYVLTQIADEVVPYKVWDESGGWTKEEIEFSRDVDGLDFDEEEVNYFKIEEMEDMD
ncbi:MAG: hypothetical protein J1F11_06955 [Oscillospiraceae bacterium]|nr:hypothetical protein [Oscillospiraceae bacterium]